MKYKSKLKRNSKYNPHSKRFINHIMLSNPVSIENCEDKIAYRTINKARQAKKNIEKDGSVMEIYKCPHCKKFHLTSIERGKESQRDMLWLSDEILEVLSKDKLVMFRDNDNQPYALFKIKDEKGSVAGFGGDNYMVTTEGGKK